MVDFFSNPLVTLVVGVLLTLAVTLYVQPRLERWRDQRSDERARRRQESDAARTAMIQVLADDPALFSAHFRASALAVVMQGFITLSFLWGSTGSSGALGTFGLIFKSVLLLAAVVYALLTLLALHKLHMTAIDVHRELLGRSRGRSDASAQEQSHRGPTQ